MQFAIDQNKIQQFHNLEFIARQAVVGFITGLHKSPFHGFSVEFAEHRLYNTGESVKHVNWKLYGKTDRLYVKRFEEETNLRCQIIIDNSSSMYFPVKDNVSIDNPNKITFSIYCSAALMYLLKKQRDAVGLSVFSDKMELHTHAKSSSVHHKYLYSELEKLLKPVSADTRKTTFVTKALHEIAESIHKRSLVIIFSDMMESSENTEEIFSALQHLKHNKHEVLLFHVTDKQKELDFEFENRPYKFIDMETGEELRLTPNEIKDKYITAIADFKNKLKLRCAQYKIDFIEADINRGFKEVLLPYLIKRQKLF